MTGVWCAFVIPKRQKLSLNLWGGGQGVVFSHSSSSFSLPRLLSPPFFLLALSPVSLVVLPPLSILPPSPFSVPPPVFLHPFPLIYVVMIAVNTIHTFVLLRDGNLIFWWPSVIHVWSSKNVEKLVTPLKF